MKTLLVAAGTLALASCGHDRPEAPPKKELPTVEVKASPLALRMEANALVAIGRVKNVRESMVAAKMMGRVLKIYVKAGDRVEKGQVLLRIDASDAGARFEQAKGAVAQAEAAKTMAKQMLDRFETLKGKDAASKSSYDKAVFDYTSAMGAHLQAQGALAQAQSYLAEAAVIAPFSGRIVDRSIEEGEMASPGMPLLRMESSASLEFEATLNSQDITVAKLGDLVKVQLDASREAPEVVEGTVREIVPAADQLTHSSLVRIDIGKAEWIRSGMFGRALFPRAQGGEGSIQVPADRLVRRGQLEGVFIVDASDRLRFRLVRSGRRVGGDLEIIAGLGAGDRLVTSPIDALKDGQPAKVTP